MDFTERFLLALPGAASTGYTGAAVYLFYTGMPGVAIMCVIFAVFFGFLLYMLRREFAND